MTNESSAIVQKVWKYCHVLRDDGVSYGDYVEQLTYLPRKSLLGKSLITSNLR